MMNKLSAFQADLVHGAMLRELDRLNGLIKGRKSGSPSQKRYIEAYNELKAAKKILMQQVHDNVSV